MIRAVLYTRKSNEQYGVAEADKSVTRQSDLGRAFVESKGWSLVGEYEDDGITGGDFVNRTGLTAMRDALKKTPRPFDVIVAMDGARIGRDQFGTPGVLQDIADAGVRLWYYQAGREAILTDSTGRFMENVDGFAMDSPMSSGARSVGSSPSRVGATVYRKVGWQRAECSATSTVAPRVDATA